MSHTPGPWKFSIEESNSFDKGWRITGNGDSLMGNADYYPWVPNNQDDWRLIAAAPDLLRAVYVAHGTFARQLGKDGMAPDEWGDDEHEAFGVLKAAIAKVENK